jgi:fatty acid desaturase
VQHKADPDSPEGLAHRLFLLERERERLVALKASSERDRNNAFKMIVLAVLAVPAGVLWGFWIALAVFVQVVLLIVGTWYITGVHILEYAGNIADCDEDLRVVRQLQASAAPSAR